MQFKSETNGVIGRVSITKFNSIGDIIEKVYIPNLVVSTGLSYITSRMVNTSQSVMSNMALGSGTTSPTLANTTLGLELGRVILSASSATNNVITYTATFPAGTATGAITEAGIFNDNTAGIMLSRTTFAVINKGASDVIAVTWTVTVN